MTTQQYQQKLTDKIKGICNFVISEYPVNLKDMLLKTYLYKDLSRYEYLRDLQVSEVLLKNELKKYNAKGENHEL